MLSRAALAFIVITLASVVLVVLTRKQELPPPSTAIITSVVATSESTAASVMTVVVDSPAPTARPVEERDIVGFLDNDSSDTANFTPTLDVDTFTQQFRTNLRLMRRNIDYEFRPLPNNPDFLNCAEPGGLGRVDPPPLCTKLYPCRRVMAMPFIPRFIEVPTFSDFRCDGAGVPYQHQPTGSFSFDDGPARFLTVDGQKRYFCKFVPPTVKRRKVPLVILLPGSGANATMLHASAWRIWAQRWNFALVSAQALNRHWPPSGLVGDTEDAPKWDDVCRNVSKNEDIRFLDKLIDDIVSSGDENKSNNIDASRIYISGGSNGLMFATLYGILRSGSSDGGALGTGLPGQTPGGNKIAAVAGFSGADPFIGFGWKEKCWTIPRPKSRLPVMIVSRVCDLVRCQLINRWMDALRTEVGSIEARFDLLDESGVQVPEAECEEQRKKSGCDTVKDLIGHGNPPMQTILSMLRFFKKFKSS